MYFIESTVRNVTAYRYDAATGEIKFERIAITVPEELGLPDGMAIDEEGMLWIALYGGSAVGRWNPETGQLLNMIKLPVPHVTNCCFVGENLQHLLITTAQEHLSDEELKMYPQSGDIFIVHDVGVKGVKSNKTIYNR